MNSGAAGTADVVHQIVFHWVTRHESPLGREGVGPAAASFSGTERETLQLWDARLLDEASPSGADPRRPYGGLCYLRFGDEAAVLRRVPALDYTGRVSILAHALVGSALILTPRQALLLASWPLWFGGCWSGKIAAANHQVGVDAIHPLTAADISSRAVARERARLTAAVGNLNDPLFRMVAETVRDPGSEFSVVGYEGDPVPLLYGVIDVLDPLLGHLPDFTWSFATLDTMERPSQPRYVFLERVPRSSFQSARVRVRDLGVVDGDAEFSTDAARIADELLSVYRRAGSDGVAELLAAARPMSLADFPRWRGEFLREEPAPAAPPPAEWFSDRCARCGTRIGDLHLEGYGCQSGRYRDLGGFWRRLLRAFRRWR